MLSKRANKIISDLEIKKKSLAKRIHKYFFDMKKSIFEMKRVLRKKSYVCIIIGNTEYSGVKISNVAVLIEFLRQADMSVEKVIKRKLSNKIFTPYRDIKNGKFTNSKNKNSRIIYQYEYIVIARKK